MSQQSEFLLSLSILLPSVAALIRYRFLPASYHPLVLLLWLGLLAEVVSFYFFPNNNAVIINL